MQGWGICSPGAQRSCPHADALPPSLLRSRTSECAFMSIAMKPHHDIPTAVK